MKAKRSWEKLRAWKVWKYILYFVCSLLNCIYYRKWYGLLWITDYLKYTICTFCSQKHQLKSFVERGKLVVSFVLRRLWEFCLNLQLILFGGSKTSLCRRSIYMLIYTITKSMPALWLVNQLWFIVPVNPRKNRASSELLYKSNKPQVFYGL